MKCVFGSSADAICLRCERRGAKCVGQEYPEEISAPLDRSLQMGDRVVRVEALVEQLLEKVSNDSDSPNTGRDGEPGREALTPTSIVSQPTQGASSYPLDTAQIHPTTSAKYERLSRILHESLPSQEDTEAITKARGDSLDLFYLMHTTPYKELEWIDPRSLEKKMERPRPTAHPVLIARYMLQVATFLQHVHSDSHEWTKELSEPSRVMMKRLSDTAIALVTTDDDLTDNIEGLDCILMESYYQINAGNLRKGLTAIRRAMAIAQVMGFHRSSGRAQHKVIDPTTEAHPHFTWFRILSAERHLCLMLGLPQGTLDHSMASETALAGDIPLGRLERLHCVIASRILDRNIDPSLDNSLTQELDRELQRAAGSLPSKWWLTANLATSVDEPKAFFWDMRRLFAQLFHYTLLRQLHLPNMLHSSSVEERYDYSRMTCINASREVLSRFLMFWSFNQVAFSCRAIDFFSLMAAMTLLLAHLDEHRRLQGQQARNRENLLAHQRPSDRAMIEQAQESMEEVSRLIEDTISAQSASLLRRLLAIEAEAASGNVYYADNVRVQMPNCDEPVEELKEDGNGTIRVSIPYFGIITITGDGDFSNDARSPSTRPTGSKDAVIPQHSSQSPAGGSKDITQHGEDSLSSPSPDDWAFQDVDMTFFNSLMGGVGGYEDDGIEWPTWLSGSF